MFVSLEISNKDPAYDWFLAWMSQQSSRNTSEKRRLLSPASWTRSHQLSVQTAYEQRKNGSASVFFKLVAGPGTHWIKYQHSWLQVILYLHIQLALELIPAAGKTRARNSFSAAHVRHSLGDGHTYDPIPRPTHIPQTPCRSQGYCYARSRGQTCHTHSVGD